jgi:alpha-beta hydrolase superfamily lysophospholipase
MIRGRRWVSTSGPAWLWFAARAAAAPVKPPFPTPDLVFTMPDGATLPARVWRPAADAPPQGTILALHGFTDSRDWFEFAAPAFTRAGWRIVAPDQRGFGATQSRGTWPGKEILVADAAALAAHLRPDAQGRLVMLGESMGSAVLMVLAAHAPRTADAFVLTSPAVWGRAQMPPSYAAALWAARQIAPNWRLTGTEIPLDIAASDNREALIRFGSNPLTLRGATVAMISGLVNLMDAAQHAAPRLPETTTLILNGRRDQVVPTEAAAAAWSKLPPGLRRGLYLNGYHLLLRDLGRALVEADILAWLKNPDAWLPSGADANAAAWQADHGWEGATPALLPAGRLDGVGERRAWPY